jgi:GNAT superfamily N-acetyltransferase
VPETSLRPLRADDIDAVHSLSIQAFEDLARRLGERPEPMGPVGFARLRMGRLLDSDPGGAWVAELGGEVVGSALALMREGVWGLSLLVVRPDVQSSGVGTELLARAREYGDGARGQIVLASRDPRALRSYAHLGLSFHPAFAARGRPRGVTSPPEVRLGTLEDLPLTEAVDRHVRGAAHGEDIAALLSTGGRLLVVPDAGYAVVREGTVRLLAARDEASAAALLRGCFAESPGRDATVEWITSAQGWAVEPCLEAGLELRADLGAVFLGGDVGPFSPYLPSGSYL